MSDQLLPGIGDNSGTVTLAEQISDNLRDKHASVVNRSAELAGMIERAPTAVDNEADANKLSEAVRQCTAFIKAANATRVEEKEPYQEGGRAVDGFFQNLITAVKTTKEALERVRTAYDIQIEAEARRKREDEAQRAREEANRLAAEARTRADQDRVAVAQAAATEAHEAAKVKPAELTRTRSDSGVTTSLRSEWLHEVIEAKKVPRKFCTPDNGLLKAAVKAAVTADGQCPLEIPGVRIYERKFSQVR